MTLGMQDTGLDVNRAYGIVSSVGYLGMQDTGLDVNREYSIVFSVK
jgi:hypothetical protein